MNKIILFGLLIILASCKLNDRKKTSVVEEVPDSSVTVEATPEIEENEVQNNTRQIICKNGIIMAELKSDTLFLLKKNKGNSKIIKTITPSNDLEHIDDYKFFKYSGDYFFKVQITTEGTGHSNYDHLFHINATNNALENVEIRYASDHYLRHLKANEGIWKGESREYSDNQITAMFFIWKNTDANCCPSAGEVLAKYKIEKIKGKYIMQQDTCIFSTSVEHSLQ